MKLDEYRKKLEKEPLKKALPHYIEVEDVNEWGLQKNGEWFVMPNCWGVVHKDGTYIFFITEDDDIGRIWHTEEREDEDSLVEYIKERFDVKLAAAYASTDTHNNPALRQKAEDTEFRIKVISSIIVMAAIVILVAAGKFVVKQVNKHFHEEPVPIEKLDPEIKMDFDTDTIITEDELNEWNESLDDIRKHFTESNNESAP